MLARGGQCLHSFQTKLVYTALHWVHCVKWRGRRGSGDLMLQIWEMRRIVNKWYNKVTMKGEQVQDLCDCVMLRGWQCTVYSVPYTGDSQISVLALKVKCLPKCCRQNNNWQEYDTPNYSSPPPPHSVSADERICWTFSCISISVQSPRIGEMSLSLSKFVVASERLLMKWTA